MENTLAKVPPAELAKFLRLHGEYWALGDCPEELEKYVPDNASVDELIDGLSDIASTFGEWDDMFYLYNCGTKVGLTPDEIADTADVDAVPCVMADEIEPFIVRSGGGKELLYIACHDIQVTNGQPMTILPAESPEQGV